MKKMSVAECMNYFRENPVITITKAMRDTGLSRVNVYRFAEYANATVLTQRNRQQYCKGAPKSCENCPYADCINWDDPTVEETTYVNKALGLGRRRDARKNDK